MSDKSTGGAAFPSPGVVLDKDKSQYQQGAYGGMSLRDYFAGQVLAGVRGGDYPPETVAEYCYRMADGMLKERLK